jgi:hypothetical protein
MQSELGFSRGDAINVIEQRERQPFQTPEELAQVDGFNDQKVEELKGKLSTSPPTEQKSTKQPKAKKPARKRSARKSKSSSSKPRKPKATTTHSSATQPLRHGFAARPPVIRLHRVASPRL